MNESHLLKYGGDETVTVTPVDANHCAGAAMFLFEGHFGRILYTGDFRYSGPMSIDANFHSLCSTTIDVLYLDNTFCDARCIFPSREDAVIEMLRVIRANPDAQIKIGLRRLGKEQMLVAIARAIGEWIGVTQDRYRILEILCMANVFRVSSSCRIQAVLLPEITVNNMTQWSLERQTIAIVPTAIGVAITPSPFPQREDIHVVPYSDHSSYEELQEFVSLIEPRKICPILGPDVKDRLAAALPNRADMSCFQVSTGELDQVRVDGSAVVVSSEHGSASSSYSTNMDETGVETTRAKARKKGKQKGGFSSKKKPRMGVVFSSSESPVKRCEDVTENERNDQPVMTSAGSARVSAEQDDVDCTADAAMPMEVIDLDPSDTTCDRNMEEDLNCIQSNKAQPLQSDSVHLPSDDKSSVNADNAGKDPLCSNTQGKSAHNLDCLDNAWLLQVVQPLILKEAEKIISKQQSFRKSFRR